MTRNDYPFANPQYQLWLHLSGTKSIISKARQTKLGKYTHHNQAAALNLIWSMDGRATPGFISRALFLQHHTVSELLTRLENKGLIRKHRDEQTRNVVRLNITAKGKAYCVEVTQGDLIKHVMGALTIPEQEQLKTFLSKLIDAANREMGTETRPEEPTD